MAWRAAWRWRRPRPRLEPRPGPRYCQGSRAKLMVTPWRRSPHGFWSSAHGASGRSPVRPFEGPPVLPLAERCTLNVQLFDRHRPVILPDPGSRSNISNKDALPGPSIEAVVDRGVRAVGGRAVMPACARAQHVNDAADDPPIVITFRSGQVSGQARRNACPLPVIQPKQPCAHRKPPVPNRSARENQNALIRYRP